MCTLIALHRPHPRVPLVVAANRDEYLDRPASGLACFEHRGRRVVAPRDLRAGGTWLGLNDRGMFAAFTNRPNADARPEPALARAARDGRARAPLAPREAAEALAALPVRRVQPLQPVRRRRRERASPPSTRARRDVTELAPGAHVIGNADPDDRGVPKVARLLDAVERVAAGPREWWLEGLAAICRSHDGDGAARRRVRASRRLRHAQLDASRARRGAGRVALLFAEGPPCRTELRDRSSFLSRAVPRRSGGRRGRRWGVFG